MLSRKITFVLGAGASAELGFPLGSSLQQAIQAQASAEKSRLAPASALEELGDLLPISLAMTKIGYDYATTAAALARLQDGALEAPSIDTFLHNNRHQRAVVDCGKLSIVYAILSAERDSPAASESAARAYNDKRSIPSWTYTSHRSAAIKSSFISLIWDEICQTHTVDDVNGIFDNIAFVNFNYDRSLEETFTYKLMTSFGIDERVARGIVDKLDVIRPYGSPHGNMPLSAAAPRFGDLYASSLGECAGRIRTFTEAAHDTVPARINALMCESKAVVFLGFGFHRQNVDLFGSDGRNAPDVYYSMFGGSVENCRHIESMLTQKIGLIADGRATTSKAYNYHLGTSLETLRRFQFPIFRNP